MWRGWERQERLYPWANGKGVGRKMLKIWGWYCRYGRIERNKKSVRTDSMNEREKVTERRRLVAAVAAIEPVVVLAVVWLTPGSQPEAAAWNTSAHNTQTRTHTNTHRHTLPEAFSGSLSDTIWHQPFMRKQNTPQDSLYWRRWITAATVQSSHGMDMCLQ